MNAPIQIPQLPASIPFVPIMTRARFAALTGLTDKQLESMIFRGYIPAIRPSCGDGRTKLSFVNIAKLMADCMEDDY